MKGETRRFVKGVGYVAGANGFSTAVSVAAVLLLPRILTVSEYGYWQLYLLYLVFAGFLHLGYPDGVYLRYGGARWQELEAASFRPQFQLFVIWQSVIGILVVGIGLLTPWGPDRSFVVGAFGIGLTLLNVRYLLLYILQASARFREYSFLLAIDRVIFIISGMLLFFLTSARFEAFVFADLIGKLGSLLLGIYLCWSVLRSSAGGRAWRTEFRTSLGAGFLLMLANTASLWVTGVARLFIERSWAIEEFAKVSLSLQLASFMLTFAGIVGTVVFPFLRRREDPTRPALFRQFSKIVSAILWLLMLGYFPLVVVVGFWLPEYSSSLRFTALSFGMVFFEGRMAFVTIPYMKTLRLERLMLIVNLGALGLSVVSATLGTFLFHDIYLTLVGVLVVLMARSWFSDLMVRRRLGAKRIRLFVWDLLVVVAFLADVSFLPPVWAAACYGGFAILLWLLRGGGIRAILAAR